MDPDASAAECGAEFDPAFGRRAPHLGIVREMPDHRATLRDLMIACSPLRDLLPGALLDLQFESQDSSFRAARPRAMRRIVMLGAQPIGRIIVDWDQPGASHGVDIAVHPDHRRSGAALAMLRAWIGVADASGRACTLDVIADNPARRIYQRLGFVEQPGDPAAPYAFMQRHRP